MIAWASISTVWLPTAMTGMSNAFLFVVVIVLLLYRPSGLLRIVSVERV